VTSFVGRENELKLITQLVGHRALVTLTGVGGVGKTRLAVQVAAEVAAGFPDGAWLCELAAVNDPSAVWTTLAATLSILPPPGRSVPDAVLDYLGPKRLLVVIDNCEHLLSAVAKVIDAISHRCRDVALIATSREGLAVAGEQIIAVPALAVAEAGADRDTLLQVDAVRLFCDRAVEASSNFAMTDGNAAHVAQLCRRLDGIPLAIELAAARVRSLPPEELVARLDQRFRLLTRGSRAALERQQTLRNTIDWSYDLLSEAERMALNRVSVFAGGWDLDAAEAVVGGDDLERSEVVDVLGQLVDKSLVDVAHTDGGARYRLLETIRQYAQERLEMSGGAASVRGRHLDHFLAVSEQMGPRLRGREQLECSALLSRDADNLRAALDWAVEASLPDQGLRLVVPLQVTGIPIGWTANDWAETAASIEGAPKHELYPAAVAYAALGTTMRGERDRAGVLVETALDAQARLATNHLWVHAAAGTFAFFQGDLDRARHHAETWVGIARASKDPFEVAQSLILLAAVITTTDPTLAITVAEEAVHISRDADIPGSLIYALLVLGPLILEGDEPDRAVAVLDEAAQVASELGDRVSVATAHMSRAQLALAREDWPAALQTCALAADQQLQVGQMVTFGAPLSIGYVALAAIGRFESAAILMGLADRFPLTGGLSESLRSQAPAARTATLQALGTQRFEQLSGEGAKLSPAEAVAILRTEADTTLSRNAPADR
jgi:predicted ATPase